ncbi:ABC transporter ATP-binding protein [Pelagibius sp. Alg239-R121]|uniref:ABC transporter ATP-binding protein n=1 Tax=Pelagibius sp. Alg239-R121 TaxID=2993448 RepID=UPI002AC31FDA|nr:ABC transporter ATP-binding protein [Pelagibius sp. Alg239-R121]
MSILEVRQLTKRFGGLAAVNEVSFNVEAGEILSIIGPNGAGKSTLFKLISSFLRATSGEVIYEGENIVSKAPHIVARKGVVRTFQETTIFKEMTALDNVVIAHHLRSRASLAGFYWASRTAKEDEAQFRESAEEILNYLGIGHVGNEIARNLPHGYLRALGMAIGLAAQPKLLLFDEPFAGMNHEETQQAVKQVYGIRDRGLTVLLVEHDMPAVMKISDRIVVLNFGQKIAEGTPTEIQDNEQVIEAYLGREDEEIGL